MKFKLFTNGSLIILLIGCTHSYDFQGTFAAKNQFNIADTIIITGSTYTQKIYRKMENSLVDEHTDLWRKKNDKIIFINFYPDDHDIIPPKAKDFKRFLITSEFEINTVNGKLRIYHRLFKSDSYLEKLDN